MQDKQIAWEEINLFSDNEINDNNEDETYEEKEEKEYGGIIKIGKLVQTPLGIFRDDNTFHPLRGLPIYMAHLNFPVMESMIEILNKVPGIEAFQVKGRYRLLFVFAKMFDEDEIMENIESSLGIKAEDLSIMDNEEDNLPEKAKDILRDVQRHIESEHWIVYIFPNGKYKLLNLNSSDELSKNMESFIQLKQMSGGIIYSSDMTME